ncbi:ATP-binding protein [Nocardia grenadensis]
MYRTARRRRHCVIDGQQSELGRCGARRSKSVRSIWFGTDSILSVMAARARAGRRVEVSDSFVGRADELDRILGLMMTSARLITLIGAGGVGKTRLAAEAVRHYHEVESDPVYWVRLAHLPQEAGRSAITDEIVRSVAGPDVSGRSAWDAAIAALSSPEDTPETACILMVLDNCEHVLAGVGSVVDDLLQAVPRLTILATSRTVIGWCDEYVIEVPPLRPQDASQLFLHRAQALGHPLTGAVQLATVDSICTHMQYNPLFIRLAAARLRRRTLKGILQELQRAGGDDQRMSWSHGPSTAGDRRHHSIGDVIAWSYDLCSEKERLLFERMSVFAAGYCVDGECGSTAVGADLEAIVSVCSDISIATEDVGAVEGSFTLHLSGEEIPQLLDQLVDRSLVSVYLKGDSARYSLMECLHVFSRDRLRAHRAEISVADDTELMRRHLHYYHDRLQRAAVEWVGPRERETLEWVQAAWPNIMTGVQTSFAIPDEALLGLDICKAIHDFPVPISHTSSIREIQSWTERALANSAALPTCSLRTRVSAQALVGYDLLRRGMLDEAGQLLRECLTDCGLSATEQAAPEPRSTLPEAVEFTWGMVLWTVYRDDRAVALLTSARTKALANCSPGFAAISETAIVGAAVTVLDSPKHVQQLVDEMLASAVRDGSSWKVVWAYLLKALLALQRRDPAKTLDLILEAQDHRVPFGDQFAWIALLQAWAWGETIDNSSKASDRRLLARQAAYTAHLLGALDILHERIGLGVQILSEFVARNNRTTRAVRSVLGADNFDKAYAAGRRLAPRLSELQKLLESNPGSHEVTQPGSPWYALSQAEQAVAVLASAGSTNATIAARRGTSPRTVEAQLAAVLRKLAITSRYDIRKFVPDDRLPELREEDERWNPSNRTRPRRPGTAPGPNRKGAS